jgi:hypothetical protein
MSHGLTSYEVEAALHVRGMSASNPASGIGPLIRDNRHLKEILAAAPAKDRREAYRQLKPYLKFKPLPFLFLIK